MFHYKNKEIKYSTSLCCIALIMSTLAIFYILYFTFFLYLSRFPWAPHYEPSGIQYLAIQLIFVPILIIIGSINIGLCRWVKLNTFTKLFPFCIATVILLPVIIDSSMKELTCLIGAFMTLCLFFFAVGVFIIECKKQMAMRKNNSM